ncbi:MAG: glycosyltransferase [Christensenellaceae bacterium]|jgi:glycosyltransferase involved in cell wall biosynthesis|nr:glycosyltransferase [Christensenellaceae bacterium]
MRIAFFNDSFHPWKDGVILVVDNYARLMSKGNEVVVFAPKANKKVKYDDSIYPFKVVRVKTSRLLKSFYRIDYDVPVPRLDGKFKRTLSGYNFDIVHLHSPFGMGHAGLKFAKKNKIPVVISMHSQFHRDFERFTKIKLLQKFCIRHIIKVYNACDECYAVNPAIAKLFVDYGYKREPKIMFNATEMTPVKDFEAAKRDIDKLYGLERDDKVLLFVGRISVLKNLVFLINSLNELKKVGGKFKMFFVGYGKDEIKLKKMCERLDLYPDIIWTGKVDDRERLKKIFARADLFLFPSLYDANSIVQIEAASQKTPTVFLKGAATASMTAHGVNSFHAENDEKKFALAVFELLNNEVLLKELGDNAFRDIYRTWNDIVKDMMKEYERIIESKK